jgi:hypothetical protein
MVMAAADFADWWDEKMKTHTASLEEWAKDNPGMAIVILASMGLPIASTYLSMGFVDVLRLGEGVGAAVSDEATAWDIAKGLGSDALRAVSLIPIGKGAAVVLKVGVQRIAVRATLYTGIRGGLCAPIAGSQGARRSGQMIFMKLDDILLQTHGAKYADLAEDARTGVNLGTLAAALDRLKIKSQFVPIVQSLDDVARFLKGSDVMVIKLKWTNTVTNRESFHGIHAFLDHVGRLRFSDRTGHIFSTLQELGRREPGYRGIETAVLEGTRMLRIQGLTILELADKVGFAGMFVPLAAQVIVNADQADPEIVAQSIEAKIMRDNGQVPEKLPQVSVRTKGNGAAKPKIPPVEYLTGVKFRLNHLGYAAGPPVHVHDDKCQRAIRAFQKDYQLKVDAIPGPKTQAKLFEVCGY